MATERVNEFQHFIPQFILKNFAHEYSPPKPSSKSAQRRRQKSQKKSQQPPFHRGDPILNIIDLKDDEPKISESLVKRTFGLLDMYADHSRQVNRQYIEKELGKLESQAGRTIARIKKALDSGDIAIWLTRSERDALRKFMFIMKYRGLGFFRRFHGNETGEYVEDDKAKFKEYMQKSGYSKPVDVWLKSIKTILELKMDVEGRWRHRLVESIYPDDAMWFIMHTEFYYLALCTPEDSEVEFFVTENCFNVHEGPNSTMLNPESGEYEVRAWTSYHEFNPVSPTLMLVLRSALLPDEEEDANENIREWRRRMFESSAEGHFDPERAQSLLADLPVRKARNSYSRVTSEGIKLLDGEDGSRRENHRFEFTFFKISTAHLLKINDIFLENAYYTSEIAFRSLESMKRSIEHYLQLPQESGFKNIQQRGKDPQIIYLKKLEKIAHSLDSEVRLIYSEIHSLDSAVRLLDEMAMMMAKKMKDEVKDTISHPTEFMQLYSELGGSFATLHKDLEQAEKMRIFRVKIDVWTKGLPEHDRQEVRNSLRDIYCQHTLTRRLWLYLKVGIRAMSLGTPQSWSKHIFSPEIMHGPEDVIVKGEIMRT